MTFQNILCVALGSIVGSLLRFCLINLSVRFWHKKYFGTLLVNSLATLLLSIRWPFLIQELNVASSLNLFYVVGFLGSLSTFSTFVIEILESLVQRYWMRAFIMTTSALSISFAVGLIGLKLAST